MIVSKVSSRITHTTSTDNRQSTGNRHSTNNRRSGPRAGMTAMDGGNAIGLSAVRRIGTTLANPTSGTGNIVGSVFNGFRRSDVSVKPGKTIGVSRGGHRNSTNNRHSGPRAGIYRTSGTGNIVGLVSKRFRVKPGMTIICHSGLSGPRRSGI